MNHVLHGLAGTLLLATAALGSMSVSTPTFAAESYDNCTGFIEALPATITKQGVWCLRQDVATNITTGKAVIVATNNVTIDCNYFKVGGLAAGDGTKTVGIYAMDRLNTTIRNCNIRGFLEGINLEGGGGHLVENNTLDGNTKAGIVLLGSAESRIRGNHVIGTGGSSVSLGQAFGIFAVGADIIDNTVHNVGPTLDGNSGRADAYGIYTAYNGQYSIIGNRIRGLVPAGNGTTYGIYNNESGRVIMRSNDVQGAGAAKSIGVRCLDLSGTAYENVIAGFATGVQGCTSPYNLVNDL